MTVKFQRRHFMAAAAATVATTGLHTTTLWGKTIKHKPLDPVNPMCTSFTLPRVVRSVRT